MNCVVDDVRRRRSSSRTLDVDRLQSRIHRGRAFRIWLFANDARTSHCRAVNTRHYYNSAKWKPTVNRGLFFGDLWKMGVPQSSYFFNLALSYYLPMSLAVRLRGLWICGATRVCLSGDYRRVICIQATWGKNFRFRKPYDRSRRKTRGPCCV